MTPEEKHLLQETYMLAKENNSFLRASRRNAFIGGIIKLALYGAMVLVPGYYFLTTVLPKLNSAVEQINTVQTSVKGAGAQLQSVTNTANQYTTQVTDLLKKIR
jgi:hypothetical protein